MRKLSQPPADLANPDLANADLEGPGRGADTLRFGQLGEHCVHLCVDMQRLFAEDTEWRTPWMERVLPQVARLVAAHPRRTVFTRFIPADRAGRGTGTWRRYYERWAHMTLSAVGPRMVELVPELAEYAPPAMVIDKRVYSPWQQTDLHARLQQGSINTLIVSGGETDVCVLATVLGAVDLGYRIIVTVDALCSSSDEMHEALLSLYRNRYSQQVETVETETVLRAWR
jgi:nicotinamidase-related amidase